MSRQPYRDRSLSLPEIKNFDEVAELTQQLV